MAMAKKNNWKRLRLALPLLIGFVSFGGFAEEASVSASENSLLKEATAPREASSQPAARLPRRLVISIADRKLALLEGGEVRRSWEIAVGKASTPTPIGIFHIVNRVIDPTWYGSKQPIAPGPKNPVGTRWMGLSRKGYGIHGTNAPESIGTAASKGCIRMHKDDVEELYELVAEGDEVELVSKPTGDLVAVFSPTIPPARIEGNPDEVQEPGPVLVAIAKR